MKNILLFALVICFAGTVAIAKEPRNLSFCKQDVVRYYQSHQYNEDVSKVVNNALRYLSLRLDQPFHENKKPAIVLDIDDTSLSNYPSLAKMNFGGTHEEIKEEEMSARDPAIEPTLKLYRFAKQHQIAVFFITGRPEDERDITIQNLQAAGYKDWDGLFLRGPDDMNKTAAAYKTPLRKEISNDYDVLLNMGDQISDLNGGYADKVFKLPNPFYYIP